MTYRLECTASGGRHHHADEHRLGTFDAFVCAAGTLSQARYIQVAVTDKYTPMFPIHFAGINADGTYHLSATRRHEDAMKLRRRTSSRRDGAAAIEMAFALPILIVMIWMFVQLAQIYRADRRHPAGAGRRRALCDLVPQSERNGCATPTTDATIKAKINASVYGIGPGTFHRRRPDNRQ